MKFLKRAAALALACVLAVGAAACSTASGTYRTIRTLETGALARGYRTDDVCAVYVEAALRELAAGNTIHSLAVKWFGEDAVSFEGEDGAVEALGLIPKRELIVGIDPTAYPLSYAVGKGYSGFDVELAKLVGDLLGWEVRYQPIDPGDVYIELSSGNIDCAWGGLRLDPEEKKFMVTASYMQDDIVLVSRASTKYRTVGRLADAKVLGLDNAAFHNAVDTALPELNVTWVDDGNARDLFSSLDQGDAAALVTSSSALLCFE
ncbi:MAG: transporter substrate-binding domain-containing protein [Clostridiales bacterium]|nr:transporter substrate-binding domain-containing protein [Clostridiales bacterium]